MSALFDAFYANLFFSLAIQALYLGGNTLNDMACQSLLKWLRRARGQLHLEYFSLAKCYGGTNITLLLGALAFLPCRLRLLDLSGLKLSDQERPALDSLIPHFLGYSRLPVSTEFTSPVVFSPSTTVPPLLQPQGVAQTFVQVSSALASSPSPRASLGLPSYAAFDDDEDLPVIEGSPPLLSDVALTLVFRRCQLSQDLIVESLIPSLKANKDLSRVALDWSENDLTNTSLTMSTQLFSDWNALISLRISDVKMRPRTLTNFLLTPPPRLLRLDASGCLAGGGLGATSATPQDQAEMAAAFKTFLTNPSTVLTHLIIANNKSVMSTPDIQVGLSSASNSSNQQNQAAPTPSNASTIAPSSVLLSIIHILMLPNARPLKYLDISDNNGNDALGHALGDFLRVNSSLSSLHLDGNSIGISGWQSIYAGMTQPPRPNSTLYDMPIPSKDVTKATRTLPASRQPLFLAMIANLKVMLDHNTPKAVLKAYLTKSINATPAVPWPSLLRAMDADQVDSAAASAGSSSNTSSNTSPNPSDSAISSKTSVTALLNPRASIYSPSPSTKGSNYQRETRTLGMGAMSRASVMFSPATIAKLNASQDSGALSPVATPSAPTSTNVPTTDNSDPKTRRKSMGPVSLPPAALFFKVASGGTVDSSDAIPPPNASSSDTAADADFTLIPDGRDTQS